MFKRNKTYIDSIVQNYLLVGFVLSLSAALGSMVLSTVLELTPCTLCWYQRIALFPMVIIFGAGYIRKDAHTYIATLALSLVGLIIAGYQLLLQWGIIAESLTCTTSSVSCGEKQLEVFGFITIPMGSFAMFAALGLLSWLAARKHYSKKVINQENLKVLLQVSVIALVVYVGLQLI